VTSTSLLLIVQFVGTNTAW